MAPAEPPTPPASIDTLASTQALEAQAALAWPRSPPSSAATHAEADGDAGFMTPSCRPTSDHAPSVLGSIDAKGTAASAPTPLLHGGDAFSVSGRSAFTTTLRHCDGLSAQLFFSPPAAGLTQEQSMQTEEAAAPLLLPAATEAPATAAATVVGQGLAPNSAAKEAARTAYAEACNMTPARGHQSPSGTAEASGRTQSSSPRRPKRRPEPFLDLGGPISSDAPKSAPCPSLDSEAATADNRPMEETCYCVDLPSRPFTPPVLPVGKLLKGLSEACDRLASAGGSYAFRHTGGRLPPSCRLDQLGAAVLAESSLPIVDQLGGTVDGSDDSDPADESMLEAIYDPMLDIYYDPKSNKHYEPRRN